MPMPTDEVLVQTAGDIVAGFQQVFGKHPGMRPAHAKGTLLTGIFTPSTTAKTLSTAPHLNGPVPVTVRFSNSTGIPNIPDFDSNGDPRGMAVRFHIDGIPGGHKHTDIISHSVPRFPTRTGAQFLEFLHAIAASPPGTASPTPVEKFVGSHPATLDFVQYPKPTPSSYARQEYWAVNAFKLINAEGKETFVRYHFVPQLGVDTLSEEALKGKDVDFLQTEIKERVASAPFSFVLKAQVAGPSDETDKSDVFWPETNEVVELGTFTLDAVLPNAEAEAKKLIFDPIPRVQGVEPSDDPLLEMRAAIYLISGRQRRAA